jgi:hypothetical protein
VNPKRPLLVASLVLLSLLALGTYRPQAAEEKPASGVTKWEYKSVYFRWGRTERPDRPVLPMEKLDEIMNDLGGKGWELAGTMSDVAGDTEQKFRTTMSTNLILYFKRPKQ